MLNFEVDEVRINQLLDELTREELRLYIQGNGADLIYYLKYCRDREVERLLYQKFHPENFIYLKMADKNHELDDDIDEKDLYVPYEIKAEKIINQNFYLHPWRANYIMLSEIPKAQF